MHAYTHSTQAPLKRAFVMLVCINNSMIDNYTQPHIMLKLIVKSLFMHTYLWEVFT